MSYKLLFPTYRARERFVASALESLRGHERPRRALNLGSGEGDLDRLIASYVETLASCDVNPADVETARRLNHDVANAEYSVQNGEALTYEDESFDVVLCLEVIEHVDDPEALLDEIVRVLAPGGHLILTGPNHDFPATYDPINRLIRVFGQTLPIGAYAYGHERLVIREEVVGLIEARGLEIEREERLSGALAGLMELYVPGLMQKVFKGNAGNVASTRERRVALRPRSAVPPGLGVTDALVELDALLSRRSDHSVSLAFVSKKPDR